MSIPMAIGKDELTPEEIRLVADACGTWPYGNCWTRHDEHCDINDLVDNPRIRV